MRRARRWRAKDGGEPANGPFSPGQEGYLDDNGGPSTTPTRRQRRSRRTRPPTARSRSTTRRRRPHEPRAAQFLADAWGAIGVDVSINQIEQSTLINNALFGDPLFGAFGWRNHAGFFVDQQNFWWHGFGAPTDDGGLALNFGRLNDPVIDDLLEAARSEADVDVRGASPRTSTGASPSSAGSSCPTTPSGASSMTRRSRTSARTPLPDGHGFIRDGAGFPGQVWLTSVFLAE